MAAFLPWISDVLISGGLLVMTIGVFGVLRMPDTYLKLHAASKMVVLGVLPLLLASVLTGTDGLMVRTIPIAAFLLLTTPVSTHMVARAAYLRGEHSQQPRNMEP